IAPDGVFSQHLKAVPKESLTPAARAGVGVGGIKDHGGRFTAPVTAQTGVELQKGELRCYSMCDSMTAGSRNMRGADFFAPSPFGEAEGTGFCETTVASSAGSRA